MAKVSELPLAARLDGNESVLFVQDDETRRGPVSHLDRLIAGGSRFRNLPSAGYYRGAAVVDATIDPNGRMTAHATRDAHYVRAIDSLDRALNGARFRNIPSIGYVDGAAAVSCTLDPAGRRLTVDTMQARYQRGNRFPAASAAPAYIGNGSGLAISADPRACYLLIITGQSLAEANSTPVQPILSSASIYPHLALMLEPAVRLRTRVGLASPPPPSAPIGTKLIPLVEAADTETYVWETAASSWANHLIRMVKEQMGQDVHISAMVATFGGAALSALKRGSNPYGWLMRGVADWVAACRSAGMTPIVLAESYCQGDTNVTLDTDFAAYAEALNRYEHDRNADYKRLTGQTDDVPLILDSTNVVDPQDGPFDHDIVLAHDRLAARNSNVVLGAPLYHLPRSTTEEVHLSSIGQVRRGIGLARITLQTCFGSGFVALKPNRAWRSAGTIAIEFPRAIEIASDGDVNAAGLPNYLGLSFDDGSGDAIMITGHELTSSGRLLKLTLSQPPAGPRWRVSYGLVGNMGDSRPGPDHGPRGLLRGVADAITPPAGWPDAGHATYEFVNPFILEI